MSAMSTDHGDDSNGVEFSNRQEQLVDSAIFALVGEDATELTDQTADFATYSKSESGRALLQSLFNISRDNLAEVVDRRQQINDLKRRVTDASRELQMRLDNTQDPVLKKNLEKFKDSKPEEIKRAALDRIRKFLTENPSLLPDLNESLSGLAIESREAFEKAYEHNERLDIERVEQQATISSQNALLRTYNETLTAQNNNILGIQAAQKEYQTALSEANVHEAADAQRLQKLEEDNRNLHAELAKSKRIVRSKENDILELEQRLQGDEQRYIDTSMLLETSNQTLEDVQEANEQNIGLVRELREANAQLDSDLFTANVRINQGNTALATVNAGFVTKEAELRKVTEDLKTAEFNASLEKQINKTWSAENVKVKALNRDLSASMDAAATQVATLEASETAIKAELAAANAKIASLEDEATAYKQRKKEHILDLGARLQAEFQTAADLERDIRELRMRQAQSQQEIDLLQAAISDTRHILDPSNRFPSLFDAAEHVKRIERPKATTNSRRLLVVKSKLDPTNTHQDELTAAEALQQQELALQSRLAFVKQTLDPENIHETESTAIADYNQQFSSLRARLTALRTGVDPTGVFPHELEAARDLHRTIADLKSSAADVRQKLDPTLAFHDEFSAIRDINQRLSLTRALLDPLRKFPDEVTAATHLQATLSTLKLKLDPENKFADLNKAADDTCGEVNRLRTEVHDLHNRWPFYYGIVEALFLDVCTIEGLTMQALEGSFAHASELNASLTSSEVTSGLSTYQIIHGLCIKTELQRRSPLEEAAILLGRLHGPTYQLDLGHIEAVADSMCHADINSIRTTLLLLYAFVAGRIELRKDLDREETYGNSLVILRLFEILSSHITGGKALQKVKGMFERIQPHLAVENPLVQILQASVLLRVTQSKGRTFDLSATMTLQQRFIMIDELALTMISNNLLVYRERTFDYALLRPGQFDFDADILLGWQICFEDAPLMGTSKTSYWSVKEALASLPEVFEAYFRLEEGQACLENAAPELDLCDRGYAYP